MKITVVTNEESREPLFEEITRLKESLGMEGEIEVLSITKNKAWNFRNYLFAIEDEASDFLSIVKSAKESGAFDEILICDTVTVAKDLISLQSTSPYLITLDFLLGSVNTFYEDTSSLYQLLKLKFPKTEIVGFTNYESSDDEIIGNQAQKLISLFIRNGESVYDKFSFRVHATLANVFRDKIRLLLSRRRQDEMEIENEKLRDDISIPDADLPVSSGKDYLVGHSRSMRLLYKDLKELKYVESNVLILGESGSGKDPVARAIYEDSPRGKDSVCEYYEINCGEFSTDSNSVLSRLFGHVKGAYTGADDDKRGILEIADNGTIFFDEVGNIPIIAQEKLLTYLDDGEFYRWGNDEKKYKSDVRLIFATNGNPDTLINQGKLKFDFYQRINTFEIRIPSLSQRKDDIPILINYILNDKVTLKKHLGSEKIKFTVDEAALLFLKDHNYSGNVRQLKNVLIRAMAYARSNNDRITIVHATKAINVEGGGMAKPEDCKEVWSFLEKIEEIIRTNFLSYSKVDIQDIVPYFASTKTNKLNIARPYFSKYELIPRKACIKKLLEENSGEWPLIRAKKINLLAGEKGK